MFIQDATNVVHAVVGALHIHEGPQVSDAWVTKLLEPASRHDETNNVVGVRDLTTRHVRVSAVEVNPTPRHNERNNAIQVVNPAPRHNEPNNAVPVRRSIVPAVLTYQNPEKPSVSVLGELVYKEGILTEYEIKSSGAAHLLDWAATCKSE